MINFARRSIVIESKYGIDIENPTETLNYFKKNNFKIEDLEDLFADIVYEFANTVPTGIQSLNNNSGVIVRSVPGYGMFVQKHRNDIYICHIDDNLGPISIIVNSEDDVLSFEQGVVYNER